MLGNKWLCLMALPNDSKTNKDVHYKLIFVFLNRFPVTTSRLTPAVPAVVSGQDRRGPLVLRILVSALGVVCVATPILTHVHRGARL